MAQQPWGLDDSTGMASTSASSVIAAWLGLWVAGVGACSGSGVPPGPKNTTGGGGPDSVSGGAGRTSGGDKGTGGAQGLGGSLAVAGSSGSLATDGGREQGGAAAGNAGTNSGVPAGGGGAGGVSGGGSGGASRGGSGSAGAQADPRTAAQVLDAFALLKPCFSSPANCAGCTCDENASNILNSGVAPENQHITKVFGGDVALTYNVKLRVAGVSERYWYDGGSLDATSKVFYTGGLPTIHSAQAPNKGLTAGQGACKIHPPQTDGAPYNLPLPFTVPPTVAPADGCYNGFNIFAMTVSSPKQTYFLNYTADFDNVDRQPHAVYKTDYTVTIPIVGQATIDFYVIDGDHHQVANTTMTVPNLKNTQIKQPYSGTFLELEVVDVTTSD